MADPVEIKGQIDLLIEEMEKIKKEKLDILACLVRCTSALKDMTDLLRSKING